MDPVASTLAPSEDGGAGTVLFDGAPSAGGGLMGTLPMMGAILAIFYFLVIRPQQKEQKQHQELLATLKKGDPVVTVSGLHGKVFEVRDAVVVIEVADKVRVTVDKASVKRRGLDSGGQ